ncbi:MAG TPA: flagellar assembly protein FliX [Acetobacteraceae bacterium]|nr:flagellar assembly protein FliX [Acetobacteraceae bacterium]
MTAIDRVGAQPPSRPAMRPAGTAGGVAFPSPTESAPDAARSTAAAVSAPVALESLLALQQVDGAPERDRAAHRRGLAMLAALGRLQRVLLGDGDPALVLDEINELSKDVPVAGDPGLAAAVDHVVLRARIELVRRRATLAG